MVPPVTAPGNLPDLVRAAFVRARTAGDLTFFPTQVALLRVNGIPFQLRFAPALAKKPKAPKPASSGGPPPPNPFEEPPAGLVVLPQLGPDHRLVLNKFAICQDHAILATSAFRPQHHLLDATDLAAAYACIEAYAGSSAEELFVFFNSGRHSGASQPHRHLQLLPVARMREGMSDGDAAAWSVFADQLLDKNSGTEGGISKLPFYVAAAPVRDSDDSAASPSPKQLHDIYLRLYRQALAAAANSSAVQTDTGPTTPEASQQEEEQGKAPARLTYNLALTRRTMALCPRTADGAEVFAARGATAGGGDNAVGALSLNGTVLAGTALVKNEAEWDALRQDPDQLVRILRTIGVQTQGE